MSLASRAWALLCKQYRRVLDQMRQTQWMAEYGALIASSVRAVGDGLRPGPVIEGLNGLSHRRDRARRHTAGPRVYEVLEPRVLMSINYSFDSVNSHTMAISGWAYDTASPSTSIKVKMYIKGVDEGYISTNIARPDINSNYGIQGTHGFCFSLQSNPTLNLQSGATPTVTIYAFNAAGPYNPSAPMGTQTVWTPLINMDTASNPAMNVSGWAYDPNSKGTALNIEGYVDGHDIGTIPSTIMRSSVNAYYGLPSSSYHGFGISLDGVAFPTYLSSGTTHTITLAA